MTLRTRASTIVQIGGLGPLGPPLEEKTGKIRSNFKNLEKTGLAFWGQSSHIVYTIHLYNVI